MTSPITAYLLFLLKQPRTKAEAGKEARRLNINLAYAEPCWRMTGAPRV